VKLVLDTNVLIAAFISRGHSHEVVEHVAKHHELFTSEYILEEFREKLRGKFRVPAALVADAVELQRSRMEVVELATVAGIVSRDPDDDAIVATAVAAGADCLVTGDQVLLELNGHEGIAIVSPRDFWEFEKRRGGAF
jgi:putative PIN family toxin of toxin-antitoxin system